MNSSYFTVSLYGIGKAIKLAKESDAVTLSKFLVSRIHLINKKNHKGSTCLHVACWKGKLDMCLMLLLRGSDINAQDKKGYTPLLVAVESEHAEIANTLINRGANVNLFNVALSTALHIAASNGLSGVIIPLLDKGADINALDINGYTPLIIAIRKGKIEVAMILLDRKADIFIKDPKEKKSAIDLAKSQGHTGLLAMLKEREEVMKMLTEKKEEELRKDAVQNLLQGPIKKKKVKITKDDNSTTIDLNEPPITKKKKKVKSPSGVAEATDELSQLGLKPKSKNYAKSVTTESVITASEFSSVSTIKKLGSVVSNDRNITDDPWVKQVTRRRKKGDLSDAQSVGTNRTVKTRLQSLLYHNEDGKNEIKTPNSKEKEQKKSSPYAICGTSPQYIIDDDNYNNTNRKDNTTFVFVDDDVDPRKSNSILCGSGTPKINNNNNNNRNIARNTEIVPRDYGGRRKKDKGKCSIS